MINYIKVKLKLFDNNFKMQPFVSSEVTKYGQYIDRDLPHMFEPLTSTV